MWSCNSDVIMWFKLFFIFPLAVVSLSSNTPEMLVHPVSINTTEDSVVEFTCVASNNPSVFTFTVDEEMPNSSKGFVVQQPVDLGGGNLSLTLRVTASVVDNNNSMIKCQAANAGLMGETSDTVILRVQGPLSSVGDLIYSFISCFTVTISWSPPFTLPGTDITGYNISATSNGTTTNYFTSNSYYQLSLTDISDSPCDEVSISVSGYNGLDGESTTLTGIYLPSVPSNEIQLIVSHSIDKDLNLSLSINVSDLCIGEYPTMINVTLLNYTTLLNYKTVNVINLPIQTSQVSTIDVLDVVQLQQYKEYTVLVTYSNLAGEFNFSNTLQINTYDLVSANVTSTSNSTVCVECVFAPYSLDNVECTVQLISTNNTYTQTFTKSSSNSVVGCIHNISTGEYSITVYGSNGPAVYTDTVTVTVSSEHIITSTVSISAYSTDMVNSSVYHDGSMSGSEESTEESSNNTAIIIVGVLIPVVAIVALIVIITVIIAVLISKKRNSDQNKIHGTAKNKSEIIIEKETLVELQNITTTGVHSNKDSTVPPSNDETRPSSNQTTPTTRDETLPPPISEQNFDMRKDNIINLSYTHTLQQAAPTFPEATPAFPEATPTSSQLTSSHQFPSDYFIIGDPYSNTFNRDPTEPPEIPMYAEIPKDPKLIPRKKPALDPQHYASLHHDDDRPSAGVQPPSVQYSSLGPQTGATPTKQFYW